VDGSVPPPVPLTRRPPRPSRLAPGPLPETRTAGLQLKQSQPAAATSSPVEPALAALDARRDLESYQKELVRWAVEHVDATIDTSAKKVYFEVRRRLWYSHRGQVIRSLAQGSGLSDADIERTEQGLGQLPREDQVKLSLWVVGSGEEKLKRRFVEGVGRGRIFGFWTNPAQALRESSVLPGSFKVAYLSTEPPDVSRIRDLPQIEGILDYWEASAQAWADYRAEYLRLSVQSESKKEAESGFLWFGNYTSDTLQAHQTELGQWESGWRPEHYTLFMEKLAALRSAVGATRTSFGQLAGEADRDGDNEGQITGLLAQASDGLSRCAAAVGAVGPRATTFSGEIEETRRAIRALRATEIAGLQKRSWWEQAVSSVTNATAGFVAALAKPDNWLTALEIGLEIAAVAATGGASVLIKIGKWLVTAGVGLTKDVTALVAKVGTFTSLDQLQKLVPLTTFFAPAAFIRSMLGALFGEVTVPKGETSEKTPRPEKKKARSIAGKLFATVDGLVSLVRGTYGQLRGFVAERLGRLDLTQYSWFRQFALFYARLVRLKQAAGGSVARLGEWIGQLKGKVLGFIGAVMGKIRSVVAFLSAPAKQIGQWVGSVVNAGVDYLLERLVTNPPSAILKAVFKAVSVAANVNIVELIKAKIPFADALIKKVGETVSGLIGGLIERPAKEIATVGQGFYTELVVPLVENVRNGVTGLFSKPAALVDRLSGGLLSSVVGQGSGAELPIQQEASPTTSTSPHLPSAAAAVSTLQTALSLAPTRGYLRAEEPGAGSTRVDAGVAGSPRIAAGPIGSGARNGTTTNAGHRGTDDAIQRAEYSPQELLGQFRKNLGQQTELFGYRALREEEEGKVGLYSSENDKIGTRGVELVDQGEIKATSGAQSKLLVTFRVNTCTVVVLKTKDAAVLGHFDAGHTTDVGALKPGFVSALLQHLSALPPGEEIEAYVVGGYELSSKFWRENVAEMKKAHQELGTKYGDMCIRMREGLRTLAAELGSLPRVDVKLLGVLTSPQVNVAYDLASASFVPTPGSFTEPVPTERPSDGS